MSQPSCNTTHESLQVAIKLEPKNHFPDLRHPSIVPIAGTRNVSDQPNTANENWNQTENSKGNQKWTSCIEPEQTITSHLVEPLKPT